MRYTSLKIALLATMAVSLSACSTTAWHRRGDYREQAKSVPAIKTPKGTKIKALQDYYPVPDKNISTNEKKPSLVPPGSDLSRFNPKIKTAVNTSTTKTQLAKAPSKITIAKWAETKKGDSILLLSEKPSKAWGRMGKALQGTPYQVLDEDRASGSYYVLDTKSTGNRITEKTPIYRLFITASKTKNEAKIELLNKQNKPADNTIAKRILGSVQKHLI